MAYTPTINDSNYALTSRTEEVRARYNNLPSAKSSSNHTIFTDEELEKYKAIQSDSAKTEDERKADLDAIMAKKTPATKTVEKALTQEEKKANFTAKVAEQTLNANPKNTEKVAEEQAKIEEYIKKNGYSLEKARENEREIVASLASGSDNSLWYGLNKDYRTINPYDTTPKVEQTEEQKMYSELFYVGQTAGIDKLYATQGQALSQFRVNAKTISDMVWDMYGRAGTSDSVDRIYGYTIDSILSSLYNVSPTEVAQNREAYKTMSIGKNVDNKTYIKALWDSFNTDAVQSLIAVNEWLYAFTDDEKYMAKVEALEKYEQRELADYKDRGWLGDTLKKTMPIVRQGLKGYLLMLTGGAIGSAIGSAAGMKVLTANATANNLFYYLGVAQKAKNVAGVVGAYTFAGVDTFIRESGSLMREIDSMSDEYGRTIDKDTKILWATVGGIFNAIAEYATPDPIGAQISKFDFANVMQRGVGSIISNFVANSIAGAISESTEEFVQSFIGDLAKYYAKLQSNTYDGTSFDLSEDTFSNWLDNATSSFAEAFFPSLFAGIGGSIRGFTATFVDTLISDENARKDIKTTALRTLDAITTPEASTASFKEEVAKYQNIARQGRVISESKLDIDGTKLSKEAKKAIKEEFIDSDGKMPTIDVTYDAEKDLYVPASESDMNIAKYLYQEKRVKGFSVKLKDSEGLRYNTKTVSSLSGLYDGDLDVASGTITFGNADDMNLFLSEEFSSQSIAENPDGSVTLTLKDENGADSVYTLKIGNVAESRRARESVKTATISDNEGNSYEIFTTQGLSEMLATAVPSMNRAERDTLVQYLKALPSNVQNDIIQKLKTEGGDIRDFIVGVDTASEEYKNSPEVLEALEKGKALSIINDARIVLKDGKTRGKDVVHEVFHVLWNIYPEYRSNLVSALKQTLSDSRELNQLKEFYEENKTDLDTLGNKFGDEIVGTVNSWESFLELAGTASDMNNVEQQARDGNTASEELFARISTVILQDPSDTAIETLPVKLKNVFQKIIEKLKSLYSNLIGKSTHAPQSLEEAVFSVFRDGNLSNLDEDGGVRYSEELLSAEEELRKKYGERFIKPANKQIAREEEIKTIKEIVQNYPKHTVAIGVEMLDGLRNDNHDLPMKKEYLTARLVKELFGTDLILLPRYMDRMLNNIAGYQRFDNYTLADGVSAISESGKTYEFKYLASTNKVVKSLNKAMRKADVGVVIVSSSASIDGIDVSRALANGEGYIINIYDEENIEVRYKNTSTKEWRLSHQDTKSQHRLDNSNPVVSIASELKNVNPEDQTPMDYSVYAVRHSEELDDRESEVVEYDGRSGYEAEDNSDRTDNTRGLQADSEGRLWVSEQYQYERGLSSSGLQRTARRFEGNELRQGAGYYVGRQALNSKLIDLIADRFGKKADSVVFVKLDKTLTNMEYFSEKLENARTGKHGYFVDSKSVEELMSPNTDMYLSEDGKTGFVIERDYHDFKGVNNIAGVFNYSEDGIKPRYGVIPILINAIQQGGNVLDCFADGLHKMYAQIGFAPYAINPFAVEYAIGDENWERDYLSKNRDLPPVMAMYFAYNDINSFARNFKNVDIDALFENVPIANDYDEMLNERNKYVQQKKGVRFSEELDDTNKEIAEVESQMNEPDDYFYTQFIERKNKDYGNIFNPDNPNSILNRNIKSWDDLTTADIDQFIKANVYVPESVLKRETVPASAVQELEDRESINRMLSIKPELRDIAEDAKDEKEFLRKAKQSLGIKGDGRQVELLNKYYNYSQTLSPKEFLVHFYLTYGYDTTTLEDLQRLKSLMSSRKVAKVTEDGKKITTVIANDTALAKLLVRVNKGMTETQVHNMAKQLRQGAPKYVRDLARTLVSLESETAKKYSTDFDPQMTSWLSIALGTEQDDLFQANLRNNTVSAEMEQATSDASKSEQNSRDISKMLERYEDRVTELVTEFEGKEIKRPTVEQLMRTINKLENTIESQQMSHNSWKNAYYQAIDQIRLLDNDKSALFRKLSKLVKLNHNISDDYQAKAIRLQKLLAYTKVVGNLSEVVGSALDLQKALWHEVVYRNNARASLRNMLSYNTGSYDAYYIDPTMRYLYKFIHNSDKIIEDTTANEYSVNATKRGERIDADDVTLVSYDYVDISSDNMEDTTVLYNPNSRKVDLSDMPVELERALSPDVAEGIKNGTLNFKTMTSADLNKVRSALSLVKQLSKMSQKTKEDNKKMRRRQRAVSVFSSQFGFDVSKLTTSERNAITESMNADPNYGKSVLEITDADIEDYIRKNPQTLFSDMADVTGETLFGKNGDIFATQFMKMQRIAERMDGQKNGPIYENFFRPLFEAYENKKGWVYKRQQSVGDAIATILGEGDPKDKRTITRNKKMLNETKMFKNATLNDGRANIKLTGWEQMGVYIYSQNIFGFIKLISSRGGNNIALEEVARINPTDTLKFIDIALMQREQNEQVATKQTNKWWWSKTSKAEGTDYYAKDILNHVPEETLLDVKSKIQSGEISSESVLSEMVRNLGDTLIDHVSEREDEVIRAGYDEYNMLTILQERYFPLVALDDNMLRLKAEQDQKNKRVSKGMLLRRQLTDTYALKLNPLSTLYTAIQNQESMINMSQTINDMHWLMSSKGGNLKGIISQKFGSAWGRYFEEYLNMMAGAGDMNLEEMDKVMNKFIGNIAVSRIALNPLVSVKQLISLVPAMTLGELNAIEVLQGFGKLTGNKKDAWKMFIEQNSPTTFYSAYNVEAEKAQRYDDSVGSNGVLADLREKSMWLTEKLDGLTKGAIWIAKYEKEIKNGASVKDASFRATQLVQTSQSITDDPSLAKMQRNKNPLWKIAFMFSNDAFQTWNIICGDMKNSWDQGMKAKTFKQLSGILLSNAILAFLASGWLPDEEDTDDNTQLMDFLKDWGCETLGNVPLVGSAIQSAYQGFDTPFYQGPVQVANLFGMISKQVEYWRTDGKSGTDYEAGDYIDRAYKVVMEGVVSPLGGPTTELERAYKALFPDGSAEGLTKNANSMWYLLGTKYGKSLYTGN